VNTLAALLHVYHYQTAAGKPAIETIADQIGCSPILIYKILEGERSIKADEFPRFYRAFGKPVEALRWLVRQCDPQLDVIEIDDCDLDGSIEDEKDDLVITLGKLTAYLRAALSDHCLDEDELAGARDLLMRMRTMIDRFALELEGIAAADADRRRRARRSA
jgi:hypothetical protein